MELQKCIEQYFLYTPLSEWDIPTLAKKAAEVHPKASKGAFVGMLRDRLKSIHKSPLMKKSAKDRAKMLLDLVSKNVLKKLDGVFDSSDNRLQHKVTVQANDINDSMIIGNMNMNVVAESSGESSKRPIAPDDDDDLFSPPPSKRQHPLKEFTKDHAKDDIVIHDKDHRLYRPGYAIDSPHHPNVERMNFRSLSEYVAMAGSSIECTIPAVKQEYETNVEGASSNQSLRSLPGAMDFLRKALQLPFQDFPSKLWQLDVGTDVQESKDIIRIMQYTLTSFHLHCLQAVEPTDHERTYFVQSIIPAFQALGQVTGLLKYNWCAEQLLASMLLNPKMVADSKHSTSRMMDGLGQASTPHGPMEAVLLEASGGNGEENASHSLNDTLKLLERATNSLLIEMHHSKAASYETYTKLKVFTIQCTKDQLAMNQVSLLNPSKWKSIEIRTCQVPNSWSQRALWTKFFELVATLMISLNEAKCVLESLSMESAGLVEFEGKTVKEALYHTGTLYKGPGVFDNVNKK